MSSDLTRQHIIQIWVILVKSLMIALSRSTRQNRKYCLSFLIISSLPTTNIHIHCKSSILYL